MKRRRIKRGRRSLTRRQALGRTLKRIQADPAAFLESMRQYATNLAAGADPIEALHGHVCTPDCWHNTIVPNMGKMPSDAELKRALSEIGTAAVAGITRALLERPRRRKEKR